MSKREFLERQALKIIKSTGEEGILQRDLWKKLDTNSREGSRISLSLSKKKLIIRQRELSKGRWTYRVYINIRPIKIDSLLNTPCISCPEIVKCEAGGGVSPENCTKMTEWLLILPNEEIEGSKP